MAPEGAKPPHASVLYDFWECGSVGNEVLSSVRVVEMECSCDVVFGFDVWVVQNGPSSCRGYNCLSEARDCFSLVEPAFDLVCCVGCYLGLRSLHYWFA